MMMIFNHRAFCLLLDDKAFFWQTSPALKFLKKAGMAELVDAPDSKSGFPREVWVRFPLPAPE